MKTTPDGRAFIEAFEGKFLHTYDDGTGVLTIGYGHTTAAGPPPVCRGQTITDTECDTILAADLSAVETIVGKAIKRSLLPYQNDALVSFEFNTGALVKGTIDDKINAGDFDGAMATLLLYDHAGGQQMPGLTRRRRAEKLMFEGKVDQAMTLAGAHKATGRVMPQQPHIAPMTQKPVPPIPAPVRPPKSPIEVLIDFVLSIINALKGVK